MAIDMNIVYIAVSCALSFGGGMVIMILKEAMFAKKSNNNLNNNSNGNSNGNGYSKAINTIKEFTEFDRDQVRDLTQIKLIVDWLRTSTDRHDEKLDRILEKTEIQNAILEANQVILKAIKTILAKNGDRLDKMIINGN